MNTIQLNGGATWQRSLSVAAEAPSASTTGRVPVSVEDILERVSEPPWADTRFFVRSGELWSRQQKLELSSRGEIRLVGDDQLGDNAAKRLCLFIDIVAFLRQANQR